MRRPILLLLSLALLLGLGGCMPYVRQTPEEETTLITVGFSQVGAESDWRVANTESMRESLSEENGFELLFDNARQKQENQFKAIRTFIQQDVDYIVLAPVTETGWESVLEEARAAGIPVIIVDRQVEVDDPSLYTSWVGSNFRKTADAAVAWLAEKLKADGREEAVQILHLQGTPGSTAQLQRSAALEAGAAAHADWTIAAQLNGDFTQAKAYEETLAYLQSNPAPDVVYCENDNMCFGVMQALDELGIAYGDGGVTLISFDAGRTALSYCKDGKIDLCAECNPLHGPRVRALIEQLADGATPVSVGYIEKIDAERMAVIRAMGIHGQSCLEIVNDAWSASYTDLLEGLLDVKAYKTSMGPPSTHYRHFTEDLPYGICPIQKLGRRYGVPTPYTDAILTIYALALDLDIAASAPDFSTLDPAALL